MNSEEMLSTLYTAARDRGIEFSEEFVPTEGEFNTGPVTLKYLEWGNPKQPTLLLLHGFAQTAHSWDLVALGLADKFHLISLDQRGHGDSDWAPDGDYSLEAQQKDLQKFVSYIDVDRINLIGLSMGGRNSYVFASKNPDLVSTLVVVDTGPRGIRTGGNRIRNFVNMPDVLDTFDEFVERVHSYVPHRSLDQIRGSLANNIRQMNNGKWTWKYDRLLRSPDYRRPAISEEKLWNYWEAIQCKILIVRGEKSDVLAIETLEEMTKRNKNAKGVVVPNSGHLVTGDNPSGLVKVIKSWFDGCF